LIESLFFSAVGAYTGPFWKKIEPMLTFIRSEDLSFLKNQVGLHLPYKFIEWTYCLVGMNHHLRESISDYIFGRA
jgi:hypothetical protein